MTFEPLPSFRATSAKADEESENEDGPSRVRSLPDNQHMARVRLSPARWQEFRGLARAKKRTVADYLGWLVSKELGRAERAEGRRAERLARRQAEAPTEMWIPPWEDSRRGKCFHTSPMRP